VPAEAVGSGALSRPIGSTSAGGPPARLSGQDNLADAVIDVSVERSEPGLAVVQVSGEIDMLTTPILQAAVEKQLSQDVRTLVIDLSAVTFLASSGLAALVAAQRTAEASGATLRLVGNSRAVTRPIVATGLRDVFELHEDVSSAI
jgi:anti-sigma B factor antagonist